MQIVSDPELSSLLMDPEFQIILQECNDPRKYSMHMSNPVTAKKIKLLYDKGLVATLK